MSTTTTVDPFDRPPMPAQPRPTSGAVRTRSGRPFSARFPGDVDEALRGMAGEGGTMAAVLVELVRWIEEPEQRAGRATVMQRAYERAMAQRQR